MCPEGKQAWMSVPSIWRLYLLGPGRGEAAVWQGQELQSGFWGERRRCIVVHVWDGRADAGSPLTEAKSRAELVVW